MAAMPQLLALLLGCTLADADDTLVQASWFYEGGIRYEQLEADNAAARVARLELIDMARSCPQDQWPDLRDQLIDGLASDNRGIWLACCQALMRRDPEALADSLIDSFQRGNRPGQDDLAADALARIGPRLSPETRQAATVALTREIEDLTHPCDRQRMLNALGAMGDAASDDLMQIAADPNLMHVVRSALPNALAATGDARVMPLLLEIYEEATADGERIAASLALGHLARRIPQSVDLVQHATAALREEFSANASAEVAAAAGLALARIGALSPANDLETLLELAENPDGRENALRAILESRMLLNEAQKEEIEAFSLDETSSPASRKVATSILTE